MKTSSEEMSGAVGCGGCVVEYSMSDSRIGRCACDVNQQLLQVVREHRPEHTSNKLKSGSCRYQDLKATNP